MHIRRIVAGLLLTLTACGEATKTTVRTVTTPAGSFTVPGTAYIDGRDPDASPPATIMNIRTWDGVPRTKVGCTILHGTRVHILSVQKEATENRYYFEVDSGSCKGWIPESFIGTQASDPVGDQLP